MDKNNDNTNKSNDVPFKMTMFRDIKFCDRIPRSLIVNIMQNNPNPLQFKIGAYKLYSKYVEVGCKLQINIPFNVRFDCDKKLKNYKEWIDEKNVVDRKQLILLFDQCVNRVYRLMDAAFVRFKAANVS